MRSGKVHRFEWRLPVYLVALLGAIISVVGDNSIQTLSFLLVAPALTLTFILLLVNAVGSNNWRSLLWMEGAIAVFFVASAALIAYQRDDPQCIRSTVRWTLRSNQYKAEVLAQKQPQSGELKHIEWDGWGFAGAGETTMYLVYDASDSLRNALKESNAGVVSGIPCPVGRIHRLETYWYTVLYPTDFRWDSCALVDLESPRLRSVSLSDYEP